MIRQRCGESDGYRFESFEGKGEVARATLVVLRYPGEIDCAEFPDDRIAVILAWHR